MRFDKTIYKNEVVFVINESFVDDILACEIIKDIPKNKKIGIDMRNVQSVNSSILIELLLNNKIKLFNLQSELLSYFSIILKDGFLKSFINYSDFSENKRELVKRHFLIAWSSWKNFK